MNETKKKKIAEISFWLITFVLIMINAFKPELGNNTTYYFATIQLFIIFSWVIYDAREHSFKLGKIFKLGILLVAIIFLPAYIFRTRGFVKGLKSIGIFLIKLILFLAVTIGVIYILGQIGLIQIS